jgi:glycosyltransferase involved in cell wall biosynthesis
MIVKNEEDTVRSCLATVAPFVQQIMITDTGSTDNTRAVLKEWAIKNKRFHDLKVSKHVWQSDFGLARNFALRRVQTNWVLTLDADDWVQNPEMLERLVLSSGKNNARGFFSVYRQDANCFQRRLSLFDKRFFEWKGAVHETLQPTMPTVNVCNSDLTILHKKPLSRIKTSAQQYLDILLSHDWNNYFGIAESYKVLGDLEKAQEYYHKAFHYPLANDETRYVSMYQLSRINFKLAAGEPERMELARIAAIAGLQVMPGAECWTMLGRVMMVLGEHEKARKALEAAMRCQMPTDSIGLIFPAYYHDTPRALLKKLAEQELQSVV